MRVDSPNHSRAANRVPPPPPSPAPRPAADAVSSVPVAPPPPTPRSDGPGKASGVIDKLASGHFNDVAALRLRTNHAEAIAAAGVELPEVSTESTHRGQGFAKALAAYEAALPPDAPEPEVGPAVVDLLEEVEPTIIPTTTSGELLDSLLDDFVEEEPIDLVL